MLYTRVLSPLLLTLVAAYPAIAQEFRSNRPALPEVALERAEHGEAAVRALGQKLPEVARHYGLSAERLSELLRKDSDLWTDKKGQLYFAESHVPEEQATEAISGDLTAEQGLVPLDQTFQLHSRPGASRKIYLDFDGHTTSGTSWRDAKDGDSTFITPQFDIDGVAGFSTAELDRVQYIWQRVAEDYASFDVDVTTQDPGVEGLRKTTSDDMAYGIRVCIGGASTDWYTTSGGAGGVAYVGSFDWNSDTPCFVFSKNLGTGNEKYVAEATSHEVGHTLDLYHDGSSTTGYYQGHGTGADGWAPIMGVGYYKPVTQFSRGEYADANNLEDDLAKITAANNIPYINDDYGNTTSAATPIGSGTLYADGIIERNTDVDAFRFDAGAGAFTINIYVDSRSPNLNVSASLYNASGVLVASSNPADSLGASFNLTSMAAGTYYLTIDGVGAADPLNTGYSGYGSIGSYTVSGNVPTPGSTTAQPPAAPTGLTVVAAQSSRVDLSWTDNSTVETGFKIERSASGGTWSSLATVGANATSYPDTTVSGGLTYSYRVRAYNAAGDSLNSNTATVTTPQAPVTGTVPAAPVSLSARAVSSTQISLKWADMAANETGFYVERYSASGWVRIATLGANTVSYVSGGLTGGSTYSFRVQAYNSTGTSAFSNVDSVRTKR